MVKGLEIDFERLNPALVKSGSNVFYTVIFFILSLLFLRLNQVKKPSWFSMFEKTLACGFGGLALVTAFILPISWTAVKIYFSYYFFQIFLFYVLPGKIHKGLPVPELNGAQRSYKCNGLLAFFVILSVFLYGGTYGGLWKLTIIYDNFGALLNVVNLWSMFVSAALYVKALIAPSVKRTTEGSFAEDMWFGTELNPEIFGFDIKFWSESRPGLMGWVLIDISIASAQYQNYGTVSLPMILTCLFHFIYVIDYFIMEKFVVSTMDIAYENFGFMLVFGDYIWVPFFYSSQTWALLNPARTEISATYAVICVLVFLFGFAMFRGSNRQKHLFKEWVGSGKKKGMTRGGGYFFDAEPVVYKCKTRKSELLISGWWGLARHMNYTGDIIISLAFGMPCQFHFGLFPYSHLMFMVGLLLHRFSRDEESCSDKYGKDWIEYCRIVPSKFIPGVF